MTNPFLYGIFLYMATLGEILKKVREGKDISLERAAAETKVSFHHLRAIEEEKWDALPAKPYVKGFLRIYANYLGLNPDRIIGQYEQETSEQSLQPLSSPKYGKYMAGLILIFAVLVGIILWKTQTSGKKSVQLLKSPTMHSESAQAMVSRPNSNKKVVTSSKKVSTLLSPSDTEGLRISRIYICSGIKNREPIGIQTSYHLTEPTFIYCFTEIIGAKKPIEIKHLWYHKERPVVGVILPVNSQRWRTWSRKTIYPEFKGTWKVIILGPKEEKLAQAEFVVD